MPKKAEEKNYYYSDSDSHDGYRHGPFNFTPGGVQFDFCLVPRTRAPWGCIVRVASLPKSLEEHNRPENVTALVRGQGHGERGRGRGYGCKPFSSVKKGYPTSNADVVNDV